MKAFLGLYIGIITLGVGILAFCVGAVITFLFSLIIKRKRHLGTALVIISAIISRVVLSLSLTLFVPVLLSYTQTPSDFVLTDTPIEWRGDLDECFVADGQVYVRLDEIRPHDEVCKERMTPIFHYQPEEPLLRFSSYNCYAVENEHGFNLIYAGSYLYCPQDQLDSVVSYYLGEQECSYYVYADGLTYDHVTGTWFGENYRINGRTPELLDELFLYDIGGLPVGYTYDIREESDSPIINIVITSPDGIAIMDEIKLMVAEDRIFIWKASVEDGSGIQQNYRAIPEDVEWRLYEAMILDGIIETEAQITR